MGMPLYLLPPSPERYGQVAIELLDSGLYAHGEAWQKARREALDSVKTDKSYEDTYPAITKAMHVAGGKHTFFSPQPVVGRDSKSPVVFTLPRLERRGDYIHISLPPFVGTTAQAEEYANTLANGLQAHKDAKGVVINLAGNTGGDMVPMIAGLSPLLPDGGLLGWEYSDGQLHGGVTLADGKVTGGGTAVAVKQAGKIRMPIAIITDGKTASSGELTLLAFRGRKQVRTFGAPTAGYATSNQIMSLYNGAQIGLTVARTKAHTGETFGDKPIAPDVTAADPAAAATAWLAQQK